MDQAQGAFHMSMESLSLFVQLAGLGMAFLVGLFAPRGQNRVGTAIGIGLVANVVGQLVIAGGGPGAFVGFLMLPVFCIVCLMIGKLIGEVASALRDRRKR